VFISNTAIEVTVLELRRLLVELAEHTTNVCVRFRLIGELWQTNHCKILRMTNEGVALIDEPANKLIFIQDLNNIMQFELDGQFQIYQPHYHYTVKLN
jgi:hypothetical protein